MGERQGTTTATRLELPVLPDKRDRYRISPTDVSQFLRLEQCERYLRLRLHERSGHYTFLQQHGVYPQSIPPLLTRSGARFEQAVEAAIAARFPTRDFGRDAQHPPDNATVAALARDLAAGATLILFQPRLEVELGGWVIRGDVDILRLERDAVGHLHAVIADIKSSTSAKVEHRLQVAFYHEMLAALFEREGIACEEIALAVLYRGPEDGTAGLSDEQIAAREEQRAAADELFGVQSGFLEFVADPRSYVDAVHDLVTGPASTASRVAAAPFAEILFTLDPKCDGCLYNEFCMKWSAEHDDLSLLPHLAGQDKSALLHAGIATTCELAALKIPAGEAEGDESSTELIPAPGRQALVRRIAATPPLGPRLDELIHRARRYRRFKGDPITALSYIPSKGYGSLPYADAAQNPNLVRVYVDVQQDYLEDRVYLLGALVAACEEGQEVPQRRRSIVHVTEGPPRTAQQEETLFLRWIEETVGAIVALAAPDAGGEQRAPIHLIFYNELARRLLLEGLGRHAARILGATPLYDFVTQLAAFDSPVVTILEQEIRELKNYPMVCQSLQSVAAYLRFDWNSPAPYREIFRERVFDYLGKLLADGAQEPAWYTRRARFGSQIPLEYAYAAWGGLDTGEGSAAAADDGAMPVAAPPAPGADDYTPFRRVTLDLLRGFAARRLEAMEHIAHDFPGNRQTVKTPFDLSTLATFSERAQTLAQALDEFVTIERHVKLADWKAARLAPPERRVLSGHTLVVTYDPADQGPGVADCNRENLRRQRLEEEYRAAYRAEHPEKERVYLSKEQKAEVAWDHEGLQVRLRLACAGVDCSLDETLALTTLREGDRVVICPRTTVDTRLPKEEQKEFTPTPKQMLYGAGATLTRITVERDAGGRATAAFAEVELSGNRHSGDKSGFVFPRKARPLVDGACYTLDADPNEWYAQYCREVTRGLIAGGRNTLYERLVDPAAATVTWPPEAAAGQARFLEALDALHAAGALHAFEESKRAYIGGLGDVPILLVQGPPGTGKSYATAFAIFARLQGAMAAGRPLRVFISCKTHAATDVLLENVLAVRRLLERLSAAQPEIAARYLDPCLRDVPLFRLRPRDPAPDGVVTLAADGAAGRPSAVETILDAPWCIVAAAPAGVRAALRETWRDDLFDHDLCDLLVLDEASQMNLPEAMMAALPLKADGGLIVVGDHRQMPPIVMHDWGAEPRRTFKEYRSYESLFVTLLALQPPMVKFAESFRLHAEMAAFLREEIYRHDGIPYFSQRHDTLPQVAHADPLIAAVLDPAHPIVVVVHDEESSQIRNPFEQALITPILEALADARAYGLDPEEGIGVVVPHRAQRAALREGVPALTRRDAATGAVTLSAVDTVERFQGGEREVILVGATESDRDYLLLSSEFLLDPRRLTVALSRAKQKMVLVAARSVFDLFSTDEETFAHAQLWKHLLRRTCTVKLWAGERGGHHVEVWGNAPAQA